MTKEAIFDGTHTIKAITLKKPWAWMIFNSDKNIENRDWSLPRNLIGSLVAIHSGSSFDEGANLWIYDNFGISVPANTEAGVMGLVMFDDVVEESSSPWFNGPYGWSIAQKIPFPLPVLGKGQQGFWDWKVPKRYPLPSFLSKPCSSCGAEIQYLKGDNGFIPVDSFGFNHFLTCVTRQLHKKPTPSAYPSRSLTLPVESRVLPSEIRVHLREIAYFETYTDKGKAFKLLAAAACWACGVHVQKSLKTLFELCELEPKNVAETDDEGVLEPKYGQLVAMVLDGRLSGSVKTPSGTIDKVSLYVLHYATLWAIGIDRANVASALGKVLEAL